MYGGDSVTVTEGGRTIFPLAGPVPKDGDLAMRHVEFAAALQDPSARALCAEWTEGGPGWNLWSIWVVS